MILLRHPFHIHIHNAYNPHSTLAECEEHTFLPTITQRWCFVVCSWYSALDCPLVSGNKTASAAITIINFNIFLRHPFIYLYIHNAYKYTVYNVTDPYSNTYILYVLYSVDIICEKVNLTYCTSETSWHKHNTTAFQQCNSRRCMSI